MVYEIPESKNQPNKALVMFYKVSKNIEYDNRLWDKKNFGRCMAAAQEILEACKSYPMAKKCIEELGGQYDSKGLEWKLETIARNADEWMAKKERRHDQQKRERFLNALNEQRASNAIAFEGGLTSGGEIIDSLGIIKLIGDQDGAENGTRNPKDGTVRERISPDGMEEKEA